MFTGKKKDFIDEVPVEVSVEIGRKKMRFKDLMNMKQGDVINLDQNIEGEIDIYVNELCIAKGKIVSEGEKTGIKITKIIK